jgi:hypothetical protein
MKISGFTMVRNAIKLYYPIKPAIESILPICDEFVVALGNCDPDDRTEEEILSIKSDKIKIVKTVWDLEKFPRGTVHAQQTNVAKEHCKGDWLFYVQSDEVVHEKYLPVIQKRCEELLNDDEVEGLLFHYKHFWGDYNHYVLSHAWYPKEIRIVKNRPDIYSWWTAQSFRRIPNFNGVDYRQREGTYKLKVAQVEAYIFHYGFVRPPRLMQKKRKAFNTIHWGEQKTEERFRNDVEAYDYGDLSMIEQYKDTHPAVMKDFIRDFDWADQLRFSGGPGPHMQKHEKLKYRFISFLEQKLFGGRQLFGFKNYILLDR